MPRAVRIFEDEFASKGDEDYEPVKTVAPPTKDNARFTRIDDASEQDYGGEKSQQTEGNETVTEKAATQPVRTSEKGTGVISRATQSAASASAYRFSGAKIINSLAATPSKKKLSTKRNVIFFLVFISILLFISVFSFIVNIGNDSLEVDTSNDYGVDTSPELDDDHTMRY